MELHAYNYIKSIETLKIIEIKIQVDIQNYSLEYLSFLLSNQVNRKGTIKLSQFLYTFIYHLISFFLIKFK